VSAWKVENPEPLGRDSKIWLREPGPVPEVRSLRRLWLFKPVNVPSHGHPQGEDWSEKIVSELGRLLGVPCADVDLAQREGVAGSISRSVIDDGWTRVLGSELMGTLLPDYKEGRLRPPGRPGHTPELVMRALRFNDCRPVAGFEHLTAYELFAGFLVLDAWVANRDRHDQNWAVMRSKSGKIRLAPSYDHASSLGFSLLDSGRERHLRPGELRRWAGGGRAHRFEHDPSQPPSAIPTLVATALRSLDLASGRARGHWLSRLEAISTEAVQDVIKRTQKLSPLTRRFVVELLDTNKGRLLDGD
jgi:hypothetical protein